MARYLAQKLISLVAVLFGVSLVVFLLIRLIPGDVIDYLFEGRISQDMVAEARAYFGLDRPIYVQYGDWMGGVLRGDLGKSLLNRRSISEDLVRRFPVTAQLTLMAAAWSIVVGVALGVVAARRPYGLLDGLVTTLSLLGVATPNFWLATLLVLFLAAKLGWFPAIGYVSLAEDPLGSLRSLALPAMSLGTTMAAAVMRMTRSAMLEVLSQDYIRSAWAKGLMERAILGRHALKNAMIPVLTIIGIELGKLLGGSLIIEQIFALPGVGQYAVSAIFSRDYPVLQGAVLMIAASYVLVNTLVDIGYAIMDPRVTYD